MVERNHTPTPEDGFDQTPHPEPHASEVGRVLRLGQLARAHDHLQHALAIDRRLSPTETITKRFVSRSGGTTKYPFPHLRVKLKPKNRIPSDMPVAVLRFPTEGPPGVKLNLTGSTIYIAWATSDSQEHYYVLDADAFSRLDLEEAFGEANDYGTWPSIVARTQTDEVEQFNLETILRDFEPDLQTHQTEVSA